MSRLYVGDIGALIVINTLNTTIPLDAVLHLILEKPSGLTVEIDITAPMVNYTTGVITYPTIAGVLSEAGEYKAQIHDVATGTDIVSDIDTFTVYSKLTVTP